MDVAVVFCLHKSLISLPLEQNCANEHGVSNSKWKASSGGLIQ